MEVMTPEHRDWNRFCNLLNKAIEDHRCDSMTNRLSRSVLALNFPGVNIEESIKFFHERGGYCDCEVLMNVADYDGMLPERGKEGWHWPGENDDGYVLSQKEQYLAALCTPGFMSIIGPDLAPYVRLQTLIDVHDAIEELHVQAQAMNKCLAQ